MAGIYVHIPVCVRRCLYCSFYTVGARIFDADKFVTALEKEHMLRRAEINPDEVTTLYIGGGTPSLLDNDSFERLASITSYYPAITEFTIEVNPEDVTEKKAAVWKKSGVNRISMGVQSMSDRELCFIGRRHDADTVSRAMSMLKKYFSNISLDIIYGLPLQTPKTLEDSVTKIVEMNPTHVSAYSLSYEERTSLYQLRKEKRLEQASEEEYESMDELVRRLLKEYGYRQYEISNFAKEGYESRHNSAYWSGSPYLGLGPGAHSFDGIRCRKWGRQDYFKYLKLAETDIPTEYLKEIIEIEQLSETEIHEEYLLTRLRTVEGINIDDYIGRFGKKAFDSLLVKASRYLKTGVLLMDDKRLHIPAEHFIISDSIIVDLF